MKIQVKISSSNKKFEDIGELIKKFNGLEREIKKDHPGTSISVEVVEAN